MKFNICPLALWKANSAKISFFFVPFKYCPISSIHEATEYPWIATEYFSLWRSGRLPRKTQGIQPGKFRGHFNFAKESGDELLQMGQASREDINSRDTFVAETATENEAEKLNNYFSPSLYLSLSLLLKRWFWNDTRHLSSRQIMPHFQKTHLSELLSLFTTFLCYGLALWRSFSPYIIQKSPYFIMLNNMFFFMNSSKSSLPHFFLRNDHFSNERKNHVRILILPKVPFLCLNNFFNLQKCVGQL